MFFDARQDGGKGVIFRTGQNLHVWRTKPGVFGVGDTNGRILTGAEHLQVCLLCGFSSSKDQMRFEAKRGLLLCPTPAAAWPRVWLWC